MSVNENDSGALRCRELAQRSHEVEQVGISGTNSSFRKKSNGVVSALPTVIRPSLRLRDPKEQTGAIGGQTNFVAMSPRPGLCLGGDLDPDVRAIARHDGTSDAHERHRDQVAEV